MLYAFHEIISQLFILQYVSRNPNWILLSKNAIADYAITPEVTFSIRNSWKLQGAAEKLTFLKG